MAEAKGNAVTVRIGGEDHTIRANVEPEYTIRCAKWVDDRIGEIRRQLGLIETHKAAILAALSITDELFQLQRELEGTRAGTLREAERMARELEQALGAAQGSEGDGPAKGKGTRQESLL